MSNRVVTSPRGKMTPLEERLIVQLAACGFAALGVNESRPKPGEYAWSESYQRVLDLRMKFDELQLEHMKLLEEKARGKA